MWTLANISGENNLLYRDQILEHGILNMIVKKLKESPKKVRYYRTATWFISNIVRGEPFPPFEKVKNFIDFIFKFCRSKEYLVP